MRIHRCLAALTIVVALAAGQARAGLLELNYAGKTAEGSSLAGIAFSPGTDFEIHAFFDSVPISTSTGEGLYRPAEIIAVVGGTSYSVTDMLPQRIVLVDTALSGSDYYPELLSEVTGTGFAPVFSSTTTPFDATAASPTVFVDYITSSVQSTGLALSTTSGDLVLTYESIIGISTSITAAGVPEPASLAMLGLGGTMVLLLHIRRRRVAV